MTLDDSGIDPITVQQTGPRAGMNLNRIDRVNTVSRSYCAGEITLDEAYEELKQIHSKQYRRMSYNLATIFVCAGFAPLFQGGFPEIAGAALAGIALALIMTVGKYLKINGFILNVFSAFGIALTAIFLQDLVPMVDMDIVIISSIMPLVPGVAITYAIRDTLQGDYLSGAARILEAFMTATAIALGVGTGFALTGILQPGGGLF